MDSNLIALSSLAMDLKRVALGYHRGLVQMADRFLQEALKRREEIDTNKTPNYINKLLYSLTELSNITDQQKIAEDSLMLSTLFQNAVIKLKNL